MKLIVGLGNPGMRYQLTRHNIGFTIIDFLSDHFQVSLTEEKFKGQYVKVRDNQHEFILLKPVTFMNLSGSCVASFAHYFKIKPVDILIIHDEIDLAFGRVQFKDSGSTAGHNGLKSIFAMLKNPNLMRLRVGVGRDAKFNTADWVLSNFTYQELAKIHNSKDFFVSLVETWIASTDPQAIKNKFNNKEF